MCELVGQQRAHVLLIERARLLGQEHLGLLSERPGLKGFGLERGLGSPADDRARHIEPVDTPESVREFVGDRLSMRPCRNGSQAKGNRQRRSLGTVRRRGDPGQG